MSQKPADRWLHIILLSLAFVACLARFVWLRADFPNHSPWMIDQAKFTDEGWWASAAVRHFLLGHWEVAGDYNPAAAVPVWPLLLTMLFHFTGVSIVAARAVNVSFSVATVVLVYLLVRRYDGDKPAAALAALLLALSPFAFAFSRLATLDTMIVLEWALSLWVASYVRERPFSGRRTADPSTPLRSGRDDNFVVVEELSARPERSVMEGSAVVLLWPVVALGILIPVMLLTKTTALVLLPSILWLLGKESTRAVLAVSAMAAVAMGIYLYLVLHSSYAGDYHYFFNINALADVEVDDTGSYLLQLLRHGQWIDRILYPAGLAALLLSLVWLRRLWKNPLFAAAWIAFAAQCFFILRRQDDYAPRYFLVMLVPLTLALVLTLQELVLRNRCLAVLLATTLTVALVLNTAQILGFLGHRQYQFYSAAKSIRATVDGDPAAHRLLLGTSGDQLALMTGIPAINDGYSSQDLTQKVSLFQPGWYVGWNDLDDDVMNSLSGFRLDEVANFPVFDRGDRNRLKLYRMIRLKEASK